MAAPDGQPLFEATIQVVTYDPVRRKGFMKIAVPPVLGVRIHFVLSMLPEPFKGPIVAMSRPLNYRRDMSEEDFEKHMREIKRAVVGARFRATLAEDSRGRPVMARRTITHLPASDEGGPGDASVG